jgi:hypothetical protein
MAGEFEPTEWIYTVETARFAIDDVEYPVSAVTFTYQHNGMPAVKIGLAATSGGMDADIESVDMATMIKYQNKIQAKVNTPDTVVTLELSMVSKADTQTIVLKEWSLQGAGIEKLGVDNRVMVSVTMVHPAYRARQSTLVVYNYPEEVEPPDELEGDNLYDWFTFSIMEFLEKVSDSADTGEGDAADPTAEITAAMVSKTFDAMYYMINYVEWGVMGGFGYPLMDLDEDEVLKGVIQTAVWNMAKIDGGNPLDALMNMLGAFQLCLIGAFDDNPLQIVAFEPWGVKTASIYDDEINSLEMPAEDPRPVAGVVMKYAGNSGEYSILPPGYYVNLGGKRVSPEDFNSASGDVSMIDKLVGEIVNIDPPQWMLMFLTGSTTENVALGTDNLNDEGDITNSGDSGAAADLGDNVEIFGNMADRFCTQHFWTLYRAGVQVSLVTRFMLINKNFPTPGNMVIPGIVITVSSRATGSPEHLLYFFVDRVQHIVDADAKAAYSQITGSFVRPAEGVYSMGGTVITAEEVKNGLKNQLWSEPD